MSIERTIMSMEERVNRVKSSKASSPESAAAKVLKLLDMHFVHWVREADDLDKMDSLNGEYWDMQPVDVDHYYGFCRVFEMVKGKDYSGEQNVEKKLVWGETFNNSLILLLMMFLSSFTTQKSGNQIPFCMRMTLEDYLDALIDLSCTEDGKPDEKAVEKKRRLKKSVLKIHRDPDMPMQKVLEEIYYRYMRSLYLLRQMAHIVRSALACSVLKKHWDGLTEEEIELYKDPVEYFRYMANSFSEEIPSPEETIVDNERKTEMFYMDEFMEEIAVGFEELSEAFRCSGFDSELLDALEAVLESKPELREVPRRMIELNMAVMEIDELLVQPLMEIGEKKYHYERHLG